MRADDIDLPPGLLDEQDRAFLATAAPRCEEDWRKRQIFRTESEARASVLDDLHFPTADAKYWQAVREHAQMAEQLVLMGFEWRRNELALARAGLRMAEATDPLVREEAAIERDECLFRRASLRQVAADRVREIRLWQRLQDELLPSVADSVDPDTHQAVSLARRWLLAVQHLGPAANPAEVENTVGQAVSFTRLAARQGRLDAVLAGLPEEGRLFVERIGEEVRAMHSVHDPSLS